MENNIVDFKSNTSPRFTFTNPEFVELVNLVHEWSKKVNFTIDIPNDSNTILLRCDDRYRMYVSVDTPTEAYALICKAMEAFTPVLEYMSGIFPRKGFPGFRELTCSDCGHKYVETCRDVGSPSTDPCPECGDWMEITARIVGTNPGPYVVTI